MWSVYRAIAARACGPNKVSESEWRWVAASRPSAEKHEMQCLFSRFSYNLRV
jgi:hypothetical protein